MREIMRQDSDSPAPVDTMEDGAEQRGAPRYTLLIRMAKLTGPAGEFLCVVRDVSETGISVKLFHPLPAGDLVLEMPNGDRHPLERVWETAGKAGFRFHAPTDVDRLIEGRGLFTKRAVRVNLSIAAQAEFGGRAVDIALTNLSQHGAAITCAEKLSIFQRLTLRAPGLPDLRAKVRWRRDGSFGLVFEDTLQFGELAMVVARLQRPDLAIEASPPR